MTLEQTRMDIPNRKEISDPSDYVRDAVAWSKTFSVSATGPKKEIYGKLNSRAIAVVGEDEAGRRVFDVQFPGNVTVQNEKQALQVLKAAQDIWNARLHDAVVTRLLTNDDFTRISEEIRGPHIHLDGANYSKRTSPRADRHEQMMNYLQSSPTSLVVEAPKGRLSRNQKLITVGGTMMVLASACAVPAVSRTPVPTPEVIVSPKPETHPLTADKALEIINTQWGVGVEVFEGDKKFVIDSTVVNIQDTLSEVDVEGNIVNPEIIRSIQLANAKYAQSGDEMAFPSARATSSPSEDEMTIPLIIEYNQSSGENRIFALARDRENHNEFFLVTHYQGKVVRTELKLIATDSGGGLSILILNTDTGNIKQLGLTPKEGESPTDVPTTVPNNIWIDKLIGLISGAEPAYAAEEEQTPTPTATNTPEPTRTPTKEPTSTKEPTATPTEKILYYECGPRPHPVEKNQSDDFPKGPDGHGLPSGLTSERRNRNQYLTMLQMAGCLTGIDGVGEGNQLNMTIGLYDTQGKLHEYPAVMGGQNTGGGDKRVSVCQSSSSVSHCTSIFTPEAYTILEKTVTNPIRSKQVYLSVVEVDKNAPWNLGEYQPDADFMASFFDALKTGNSFPTLPENKKLIVWDITTTQN